MAKKRPSPVSTAGRTAGPRSVRQTGKQTQSTPARSSVSHQLRTASEVRPGYTQKQSMTVRGSRSKGMGLRVKFMVIMSLLTAGGMTVVGLLMALTTTHFLVNQSKHHGIELAKMAAQVGRAVLDLNTMSQAERVQPLTTEQRTDFLENYLNGARSWGPDGDTRWTFIDAIQIDGTGVPGIAGGGVGSTMIGNGSKGPAETQLSIPGRGSVPLGRYDDIEVYKLRKPVDGVMTDAYRFRVAIPAPLGSEGVTESEVVVDVAAQTLGTVERNLYIIIVVAVLLVVGVVMVIANVLAGRVTKPVRILMKDMQVVSQGDLDHQTRAHSDDEIGVLASEFNRMTNNLKVAQVALVEQEKAEYELSIAREVQQQLLPAEAPQIDGFQVSSYYEGAKAVSGDYFDYIPLGNGLWGFIVADVSGKGIPGSMVMAVARTIIRLVAVKHQHNAAETLKETNRLIAKQIKRGMFVTAFYAVLDTRTGTLTYSSAGHNPMLIYRAATKTIELAAPKGIAIGFNEGPLFDKNVQEFRSQLEPNDLCVLYTDGFPEAMNEQNEEFGDDEFYQRVSHHGPKGATGVIEGVLADVTAHRGRAAQSDDLTILAVQRS